MAEQWQFRRGTTVQNDSFVGAIGEITVDTQTHELRVHDSSTVGGHIIYTKSEVDTVLSGKADAATTYTKLEVDTALAAKADLATTLAGYGITDGANTDLSNLTTSGKDKLGPQLLRSTGMILNSGSDTVEGVGIAEVYLYKNGVAKVEFSLKISQAGTSSSVFNWGINRDLLKLHNANIPTITPAGGVVTYYDASGIYVAGINGYGGGASPVSQFWQPGRVYNTDGNFGGWPASEMQINMHITGTLWGTYIV